MVYEKKEKNFRVKFCNSLVEYLPKFIISKIEKIRLEEQVLNRMTVQMISLFSPGKLILTLEDSPSAFIKSPRNTKKGCILNFNRSGASSSEDMQELILYFSEKELLENVLLSLSTTVSFEFANKQQKISFNLLFDIGSIETLFTPVPSVTRR